MTLLESQGPQIFRSRSLEIHSAGCGFVTSDTYSNDTLRISLQEVQLITGTLCVPKRICSVYIHRTFPLPLLLRKTVLPS